MLNELKNAMNYTLTENGAITHKTTKSALLDLFALGGAMRKRDEGDILDLFIKAWNENSTYALKCLFYLRDVRGGQGERRFFRVCMKWLAQHGTSDRIVPLISLIPEYGRWDDLYVFIDTPYQTDALEIIKNQLALDVQCDTPSLLAKWLKSENASSKETTRLANITRTYLGMSHKQYRKTLSILRERINVLERLMSAGRWDEIEFDKIPSRAGLIYKNAFARRDILKEKYAAFANDMTKTVNTGALYPYEVVDKVFKLMRCQSFYYGMERVSLNDTDRLMINKYWDNLKDYFNGCAFNGIVVADVSGSMIGTPMNVAISLAMYCAEKANGPYHNHYLTFSDRPTLMEVSGVDFCESVKKISEADWGGSTNIERTMDLLLDIARTNNLSQNELPQNLIIVSDMEFNMCVRSNNWRIKPNDTLFETMKQKWAFYGYDMPKITFWNVDARQNNIPMYDDGNVNYVSGFSPVLFEQIMKNLSAYDLMMDKLTSARYAKIC